MLEPTSSVPTMLRGLSVFPADLPEFDPGSTPDEPVALFLEWLRHAIEHGVPAPHAMTLSTVDASGRASARVLILKDVADDAWHFAAKSDSPKGRDIAGNPHVALTFYWPGIGRQIRVQGRAAALDAAEGRRDFLARPQGSRVSALVGRQSEPLRTAEDYHQALAVARERIAADPEAVAPTWTVYAVHASAVEFWQASHERSHVRVRYERGEQVWRKERLWP
jgi:pyridoxamine 5'-phosphate oxidase